MVVLEGFWLSYSWLFAMIPVTFFEGLFTTMVYRPCSLVITPPRSMIVSTPRIWDLRNTVKVFWYFGHWTGKCCCILAIKFILRLMRIFVINGYICFAPVFSKYSHNVLFIVTAIFIFPAIAASWALEDVISFALFSFMDSPWTLNACLCN